MELILVVALGVLFFYFNGRVGKLEREVAILRGGVVAPRPAVAGAQASVTQVVHQELSVAERISQTIPVPQRASELSSLEAFGAWVKEDWLLKLGAFIVLLGFGWFVSYAFMQNWIGPFGRITLGVLVGVIVLVFGWVRMQKHARQGAIFFVLGDAIILLTIFAARTMYDFLTPESALGVMFLSTAFVALGSVKYHNRSLAVTSIFLAGLVPLLTNAPQTDHIGLFAYLFAVALGAVWIVAFTGWRTLTTASLIVFLLYSLPHIVAPSLFRMVDIADLLLFAYAFAILFFITNTVGILRSNSEGIKADTITAMGNGLLLLAWINAGASMEWKSLIMVGWMLVFVVGAFAVFAITKRREPFFVYAGVGIAMLAAATAIDFEGAGLTIAYTIESALTVLIAYAITRDRNIAKPLALLVIGPIILSLQSIVARWSLLAPFPFEHFFVLLILSATLLLLGVFFLSLRQDGDKEDATPMLFVIGSAYVYVLLWLSLHATMARDTATMISLVIYTIIGLISYAYGRMNESKGAHYYGGALLGFTVGHLLLVDVWHMALSGRIVTFFAVGALLMGTAFMSKKKN